MRLKLGRLQPPVRRVLAVDAGSRRIKLLLAQSDFGRLRLLREELIDLQAEGLVAAEETKVHLQSLLDDWGRPPLVLVLPEHLTMSQVIELHQAPEAEVEKLIQDETLKLGGVSQSRIIYDFVRTESSARNRQQFWVTLCQESDLRERILRVGLEQEDLCEITTTANALLTAYRAASPLSSRAILVHAGAQTTVVVVLLAGQGAFAASFQMGGDFLTRALARARQIPEDQAEALRSSANLLSGPQALPEFAAAVDGWVTELKQQLEEWFQRHPNLAVELKSFETVASGGALEQPGLLDYLNQKTGLAFRPWPTASRPEAPSPGKGFEVAFGAALQALGYSAQPVSLLPDDYRVAWRKRQTQQRIEWASAALLALCAVLLLVGAWQKASLAIRKQALLEKVRAGIAAVEDNDALAADLVADFEMLRPVFAAQQNTRDTLGTMALLQQARTNHPFWYVLLADQQSYFSPLPPLASTNRPAITNALTTLDRSRLPLEFAALGILATNPSPAKPGLIAELCVPENAEGARKVLSSLVSELRPQSLFAKADLLSDDLRRSLADPKVVLPERDYVLALDFANTDYQQPVRPKRPLSPAPTRAGSRHAGRVAPTPPEVVGASPQPAP
jgi:Tfp pilus assembly PilM family ATPase